MRRHASQCSYGHLSIPSTFLISFWRSCRSSMAAHQDLPDPQTEDHWALTPVCWLQYDHVLSMVVAQILSAKMRQAVADGGHECNYICTRARAFEVV